ncbi:hypothetical protein RvVAR0630_13670 [Agrobacterium vitis]|nr:hypothetical protein RvVAR0630_13670 [Agrobacterium vitis]
MPGRNEWAARLKFVSEKWNPVFPKRQTKTRQLKYVWFTVNLTYSGAQPKQGHAA